MSWRSYPTLKSCSAPCTIVGTVLVPSIGAPIVRRGSPLILTSSTDGFLHFGTEPHFAEPPSSALATLPCYCPLDSQQLYLHSRSTAGTQSRRRVILVFGQCLWQSWSL